jgi:Uma2 family endonuclease
MNCSELRNAKRKPLEYDSYRRKHEMRIEVPRKLFTVEEYHRIGEAGILAHDRVELIEGEIVKLSPIGNRHVGCVNATATLLTIDLGDRAVVSVQNPIQLSELSEPQPDIVVMKPLKDFYRFKRQEAADAFLVIEVADTSLTYDRDVKLRLYAGAGVPEVWIENLEENVLLVYRDFVENVYTTQLALPRSATISPQAFPDVIFQVEQLLG